MTYGLRRLPLDFSINENVGSGCFLAFLPGPRLGFSLNSAFLPIIKLNCYSNNIKINKYHLDDKHECEIVVKARGGTVIPSTGQFSNCFLQLIFSFFFYLNFI